MKFTLILLVSFCAFAANAEILLSDTDLELSPEFRGPIIDGVKEIYDKAIQLIKDTVEKIKNKVQEILDKLSEATGGVVGDALGKAWTIVKKIAAIAKMGIVAQVCAKPYENKIAELMEKMQAETDVCTGKSQNELEATAQEVMDVVKEIQGYATELYEMVSQCFEDDNALGGAWCVTKQVFLIRDKVKAAVEIAEEAIKSTQEKALDIVAKHQQCVETATEAPMKELHNIMGEIQTCIASKQ